MQKKCLACTWWDSSEPWSFTRHLLLDHVDSGLDMRFNIWNKNGSNIEKHIDTQAMNHWRVWTREYLVYDLNVGHTAVNR